MNRKDMLKELDEYLSGPCGITDTQEIDFETIGESLDDFVAAMSEGEEAEEETEDVDTEAE